MTRSNGTFPERAGDLDGGKPKSLAALATEVLEKSSSPRDFYEVTAILESMGWTDARARGVFGYDGVFQLAEAVLDLCRQSFIVKDMVEQKTLPLFVALWNLMGNYLRGMMFAMPMAVSIFAMLTIRYSLWSYQYLSVELATAIATGTILSFLVTGGFMQAISRRGLMYIGLKEYHLARRLTLWMIRVGLVVTLLVALAAMLFNLVFVIFPWRMMIYGLIYYLFMSCLWLTTTVFYMLRRGLMLTVATVLGILIVIVAHEWFKLEIVPSQVVGLSVTAVITMAVASWLFWQYERKADKGIELPPVPRRSLVVYTLIPFFTYGFLYFALVYVDRVIAWSANSLYMPYVFWFRGEYELGLDWALLAIILPMGVVEVLVAGFWENLVARQKTFAAPDYPRFNALYLNAYRRQVVLYLLVTVASALLVFLGMRFVEAYRLLDVRLFQNKVTYFVFRWGVVAYALVSAGLLNSLYLFSLSQPAPVVRATLYSTGVNMVLGFILSRQIDYYWAILGLVGGALVFFYLTSRYAMKALADLDFYVYYSV